MLEQLAVVVAVALGRLDLRRAFEIQHPLRAPVIRDEPPGRPDRQDEVVAGAVADRSEDRVEQAAAFVDVQQLVGFAVAIEDGLGHRLGRADDAHHDVAVVEERDPAADRIAVRLDPGRVDQAMVVVAVVGFLEADLSAGRLDPVGPRRRRDVVEQRRAAGEALDAEQLLGVERAVGRAMLRVALWRDAAASRIEHRATGLLA